jgi:very-short-patch-repair endonuclease
MIPTPEYQFAKQLTPQQLTAIGQVKPRKWAIDFAFIPARIAVECEGGYAIGGRHTSVAGWLGDLEKYNCLTCLGWRLIRVTPRDVKSGAALVWIQRALASPMFVRVA